MTSRAKWAETSYQFLWANPAVDAGYRAGVSLHSHTMYSEESLDIVPRYCGKIPLLKRALHDGMHHCGNGFWTPPLSPRQAYRLEEKQISRRFGLPGLVSLSDHDDIQGGSMLRVLPRFQNAPLSVEWTVPFGPTFFHVGVHNLPAAQAVQIMGKLRDYTARPSDWKLKACFAELHSFRDVLLVLNHPLWDEKHIGATEHRRVLASLLSLIGGCLHAIEVNGLRSWSENEEARELAASSGYPVVSGGDRHGREPNALLNLTRGGSFGEFVEEIRVERRSHVVFMPQYREPLKWRTMQAVVDILREYPNNLEGRRNWTDRVFLTQAEGDALPVSALWPDGSGPRLFSAVTRAVNLVQWRGVRSAIKALLSLEGRRKFAV